MSEGFPAPHFRFAPPSLDEQNPSSHRADPHSHLLYYPNRREHTSLFRVAIGARKARLAINVHTVVFDTMDTVMPSPESSLLQSWHDNAEAWIEVIRSGAIESRQQVTDQAILLAIMGRQPQRVLDLGCGEGWLLRALADRGIDVVGVDGDARLIEAASLAGAAQLHVASYGILVDGKIDIGRDYDLICANFSLLHQDVIPLLAAMNALLVPGGTLLIQTLHPWSVAAGNYQDGWREETSPGSKASGSRCPGISAHCRAGLMRWTWPSSN